MRIYNRFIIAEFLFNYLYNRIPGPETSVTWDKKSKMHFRDTFDRWCKEGDKVRHLYHGLNARSIRHIRHLKGVKSNGLSEGNILYGWGSLSCKDFVSKMSKLMEAG